MCRKGEALVLAACLVAGLSGAARGQTPPATADRPVILLDTVGFWRMHHTLKPPLVETSGGLKPALYPQAWLNAETAPPPANWKELDFDDGSWVRSPARTPCRTPYLARLCLRGKFAVTEPARVRGLALSLACNGGAVVYLNGKEVARDHVAASGEYGGAAASADPPAGGPFDRLPIPSTLLRSGLNVLAIEIVRAPYRDGSGQGSATDERQGPTETRYALASNACLPSRVQLTAASGAGLPPGQGGPPTNISRPDGLHAWNSDLLASDYDLDVGDPNEPLRSIALVGARGGAFSGKVCLGSPRAIKGLRATASDLTSPGEAVIPASAVRVRYALPWGDEHLTDGTPLYPTKPTLLSALAEAPLAEFPFSRKEQWHNEPAPVAGCVVPVWVTVRVPPDARTGRYTGRVRLEAAGEKPILVPLSLSVADWRMPDPQDFRTWVDLIQSPDTLAVEYGEELWSARHWELIAQSMKHLNEIGSRTLYAPLICHTNLGNDQSMVRWIEKGGDRFEYDFSVLERYLDVAQKHMGTPKIVIFNVWDVYLIPKENSTASGGTPGHRRMVTSFDRAQAARLGMGPLVTVFDPASGKTDSANLPRYEDPASKALWQALFDQLRERMVKRGLEKAMMLGLVTDALPTREEVQFFKDITGNLPWVAQGHGGYESGQLLRDIAPVGYQARVWQTRFTDMVPTHSATWGRERLHGWQRPDLVADFERNTDLDSYPNARWFHFAETNITGWQRGMGRIGADFWPVLETRRGRRAGTVAARFPESQWMNLNIGNPVLAAGPRGPVATTRFEAFREGIQECEARIFIERALTDEALKARLGPDLAERCQEALDERHQIMWKSLSNLQLIGSRWGDARLWRWTPGVAGHVWFLGSAWQERAGKLYGLAADVAAKLQE